LFADAHHLVRAPYRSRVPIEPKLQRQHGAYTTPHGRPRGPTSSVKRLCCRYCTRTRSPNIRAAVQEAKIGPDKDIPHISAPVIVKYITDLELLGLL
jgi:hypothetical protein